MVGAVVGAMVGADVGSSVGASVGAVVGASVGADVDAIVDSMDGSSPSVGGKPPIPVTIGSVVVSSVELIIMLVYSKIL